MQAMNNLTTWHSIKDIRHSRAKFINAIYQDVPAVSNNWLNIESISEFFSQSIHELL